MSGQMLAEILRHARSAELCEQIRKGTMTVTEAWQQLCGTPVDVAVDRIEEIVRELPPQHHKELRERLSGVFDAPKKSRKKIAIQAQDFTEWWNLNKAKRRKDAAFREYERAVRRLCDDGKSYEEAVGILKAGLVRYLQRANPEFLMTPSNWLKDGCWDDEVVGGRNHSATAAHGERSARAAASVTSMCTASSSRCAC